MVRYTVKKRKKTRLTLRILGFFLAGFFGGMVALFFMGKYHGHYIALVFFMLLTLYGIALIAHTFSKTAYDITYEFDVDDFTIKSWRGEKTYPYNVIRDLNHIVPENENIYSIIHFYIGKENYLLPFSYRKELADQMYIFLNERVTSAILGEDLRPPKKPEKDAVVDGEAVVKESTEEAVKQSMNETVK